MEGVQGWTVGASIALAAAVFTGLSIAGHTLEGAGVAVGLLIGSTNGLLFRSLLDRGAPMLASAILRLAMLTLLALIAARLVGASVWTVVSGIALAQLVMVGLGVRQGLRA